MCADLLISDEKINKELISFFIHGMCRMSQKTTFQPEAIVIKYRILCSCHLRIQVNCVSNLCARLHPLKSSHADILGNFSGKFLVIAIMAQLFRCVMS